MSKRKCPRCGYEMRYYSGEVNLNEPPELPYFGCSHCGYSMLASQENREEYEEYRSSGPTWWTQKYNGGDA